MPKFIFVFGSSGTGKTTATEEIKEYARKNNLTVAELELDHYYLAIAQRDMTKPANFDVPAALEEELIRRHLQELEVGLSIQRPTYDMKTSDRLVGGEVEIQPADIIIIEGIFAAEYVSALSREAEKFQVYVQSVHLNDNYTRKETRDLVERGKTPAHISAMKRNQIACLFQYLAPKMNGADIVIENLWLPPAESAVERANQPLIVRDNLRKLSKFILGNGPELDSDMTCKR